MNMRFNETEGFELSGDRMDEDLRLAKRRYGGLEHPVGKSRAKLLAWGLAGIVAAAGLGAASPVALAAVAVAALLLLGLGTSVCLYALNNTR